MQKIKLVIFPLLILTVTLFLFRAWFTPLALSSGDWGYKFPQAIREFSVYPYAWNTSLGDGLGTSGVFLVALTTYFFASTAILHNVFSFPWVIIEKIVWFLPFITVSIIGSFLLFRRLIFKNTSFALISSLIFTTNTYALMMTGGGQMGVGMGYAMIPLVFYAFISILEKKGAIRNQITTSILAGIVFSVQLVFDLRIAYITMVLVGIYYPLRLFSDSSIKLKKTVIPYVFIPSLITLLLHFYWIVPFVVLGSNPLEALGAQYSTTKIVEFLSFAKFENTISLLHPIWPENIFGKVHFMRPEFIILPILAFSALFFVRNIKARNKVLIFSLIALFGSFLAKGSNEPFGQFYIWLFEKVPGFQMFRDSTKWYGIVALSYSLLIPYVLFKLSKIELKKIKLNKYLIILIFIIFWLFTIRQVFTGELKGTFSPKKEPQSYVELADFLNLENRFFRTLWVPGFHQYSYYTDSNPAIPAEVYFSTYTPTEIGKKISQNLDSLKAAGVRYVIISEDTEGKLFVDDRKYSEQVYQKTVQSIRNVLGLREIRTFGKIVVFEIPESQEHFWSEKTDLVVDYKYINSRKYEIKVSGARLGDIVVFAEIYDADWLAIKKEGKRKLQLERAISSSPYDYGLNSFILKEDGDYTLEIYYSPQGLVNKGLIVSGISLTGIIVLIVFLRRKNS